MNCFHLDLEKSHQNWWKRRFSTPYLLSLWWETLRQTCFLTPCSPQQGTLKHFLWGQFYFFHSSGLKMVWIGLETVMIWRNLSRLVFTQLNFLGVKKKILFWEILFKFQQMRSHNELASSRSWIWKTDSCRGREDMNLMNLLAQSYEIEQESNVIS